MMLKFAKNKLNQPINYLKFQKKKNLSNSNTDNTKMTYRCNICQRNFSARSGLTRHANAVHHGRITLFQANEPRYQRSDAIPEHDEVL